MIRQPGLQPWAAASSSMADVWDNTIALPTAYLAVKAQPFLPLQFQADAAAAEAGVAGMTWRDVVSQPTIGTKQAGCTF